MKNFPTQPSMFFGREKELTDMTARLLSADCRLLTLTGLGGSGKTRLAIEAAHAVHSHFQHGVVFVSLQSLTRSDLLVSTIAQAVGLTFYDESEPEAQLLDFLREKSLLLMLDNFEHLLDTAALMSTILTHAQGVKILVTSREALNLQEEWLYPLKGLSTPLSTYATSLEEYEAVQLFLYHARRVQPDFDLANEHESLIRICEMTAGLPLAIELAASWLKGLTASQIATEMQYNLDFLSTTTRNIETRHRSMRAVFDQSWSLLSESERLIFARLSVFASGFDGQAAEVVAGAPLSCLVALVEKSLVQMEVADRFGIHEMLHQYGMEKLEGFGETEATYARHSQYFAQMMLRHETTLKQPQQLETMQAIERDFENIRVAWEWSAKNQQVANLHAMLNALYLFGFLRSRYHESIVIFQQTIEQSISDVSLLGRLLTRRWGYLHWWIQADYQEALTNIEQALTIAVAENNRFEIAFCHLIAAYAMTSTQRFSEALPHLETSLALFEAMNEPYYVCWVLHRLGYVHVNLNNTHKWKQYTEQSLALARLTHNRVALVICLHNLASLHILTGDYIKGRHYGVEALEVATESAHQGQIAHVLSSLALCAFCEGNYSACQEYAERSWKITGEFNRLIIQPYSLSLLILLACMREDYDEGIRLSELGKRHSTYTMGSQLLSWGLVALACGLGNRREAWDHIQKVLQLFDPDVIPATVIWMLPFVAYTLAETDAAKAVELLSWALTYPDTTLNWVHQWPLFDRLQSQLQAAMDLESYQMRWKKGQALTFDSIKNYIHHEFRASSDAVVEPLLTAREGEILHLMAEGMTNPQIASQLVIGSGTVKTHTLNIYRKLDVANRTQAIVRAQELDLLTVHKDL